DEVVQLVDDDQAVGVHEAVRDEPNHRRRYPDAIELEPPGSFHEPKQSILPLDEARDDSWRDLTGRGMKGSRRLRFPSRVGSERPDEELPEQARQQRDVLPGSPSSRSLPDLVDDRHE